MMDWIETSQRKPKNDTWVLVCFTTRYTNAPPSVSDPTIALYRSGDWIAIGNQRYVEPSHWMPLPKKPEAKA